MCCNPWGCKESDMPERLNNNKLNHTHHPTPLELDQNYLLCGFFFFFFWSLVCRSIETPVRWPRCFFKLQNFPAEFHNGSMLAVYCWNISRENSFCQGGKIHIKKKIPVYDHEVVIGNSLKDVFIYTFPLSSRVWQVLGCQGKKGHL